jgi:hypothetical protein
MGPAAKTGAMPLAFFYEVAADVQAESVNEEKWRPESSFKGSDKTPFSLPDRATWKGVRV